MNFLEMECKNETGGEGSTTGDGGGGGGGKPPEELLCAEAMKK